MSTSSVAGMVWATADVMSTVLVASRMWRVLRCRSFVPYQAPFKAHNYCISKTNRHSHLLLLALFILKGEDLFDSIFH